MLVLTRLVGQSIEIGDNITITLVRTRPGGARIGIDAPREIPIVRRLCGENKTETETEATKESQQ